MSAKSVPKIPTTEKKHVKIVSYFRTVFNSILKNAFKIILSIFPWIYFSFNLDAMDLIKMEDSTYLQLWSQVQVGWGLENRTQLV